MSLATAGSEAKGSDLNLGPTPVAPVEINRSDPELLPLKTLSNRNYLVLISMVYGGIF